VLGKVIIKQIQHLRDYCPRKSKLFTLFFVSGRNLHLSLEVTDTKARAESTMTLGNILPLDFETKTEVKNAAKKLEPKPIEFQ
jgi:hypothetical protein